MHTHCLERPFIEESSVSLLVSLKLASPTWSASEQSSAPPSSALGAEGIVAVLRAAKGKLLVALSPNGLPESWNAKAKWRRREESWRTFS